jgi:hypothetical protein
MRRSVATMVSAPVRRRLLDVRRAGASVIGLAALAGAMAGCGSAPPSTAGPASAAPSPAARLVEAGPLVLDVPITWEGRPWTWHVGKGAPIPSGDNPIAFLSPQPLVDPCRSDGSATTCGPWPIARLGDGGLVVAVRTYGGPGRVLPAGEPSTVDGREARLVWATGDPACAGVGGTDRVRVIVPGEPGPPDRPGSVASYTELDACLAGPSGAAADAFDAIVASARWLPEG